MQRLDKILSEAGVASRKELKSLIRAGRVTVDGAVVRDEAKKFDEAACTIAVDGAAVEKYRKVLLMLHKPAGYVTSTDDPRDRTVMELIPERYRKFGVTPVGRLDKETEGLLLLTNDGVLAQGLLHPSHEVSKEYHVTVSGALENAAERLARVRDVGGLPIRPAQVRLLRQDEGQAVFSIVIHEGRNRQIRRMCAQCGLEVLRLQRVREHCLELGALPLGQWRYLTAAEIAALKTE